MRVFARREICLLRFSRVSVSAKPDVSLRPPVPSRVCVLLLLFFFFAKNGCRTHARAGSSNSRPSARLVLLLRSHPRLVLLPATHVLLHHHVWAGGVFLPPPPPRGAARPAADLIGELSQEIGVGIIIISRQQLVDGSSCCQRVRRRSRRSCSKQYYHWSVARRPRYLHANAVCALTPGLLCLSFRPVPSPPDVAQAGEKNKWIECFPRRPRPPAHKRHSSSATATNRHSGWSLLISCFVLIFARGVVGRVRLVACPTTQAGMK